MIEHLPSDWRQSLLVGRLLTRDGPTPVVVADGRVRDVSRHAPTVSQLLTTTGVGPSRVRMRPTSTAERQSMGR